MVKRKAALKSICDDRKKWRDRKMLRYWYYTSKRKEGGEFK